MIFYIAMKFLSGHDHWVAIIFFVLGTGLPVIIYHMLTVLLFSLYLIA